jgi:hypothetical protein
MAHTILTPTEVTRKALAVLHNKLKFIKTINREYDSRFAQAGAKNGGSLLIREPNQFTVRTGAVMDTQDVTEASQTLTLATQKGVDINFSSVELTLSLDDFAQRILEPAMSRLAADVEYTVLSNVYKDVYNLTGDPDAEPDAMLDVLRANARVSENLAPESDRNFLLNSSTMAPLVNAVGTYFHKASELERAFADGYIGQAAGLKWWESNMVPSHTNGNRDDSTPVVNTSTGITSGTATIAITALDSTSTVKKGDVFTVAGVWAVNPETKQRYGRLQQFVVTADGTASGGALTVSVSPTPITSGAKQNCEIVSAGSGKAVVFEAAGGSGDASAVLTQPLCYHKDAFTFVTADLEMPKGVDFSAREVFDGISLRVVRQFDIVNDKFPCRIDVLFGYKTIRPEWAVRVRG